MQFISLIMIDNQLQYRNNNAYDNRYQLQFFSSSSAFHKNPSYEIKLCHVQLSHVSAKIYYLNFQFYLLRCYL